MKVIYFASLRRAIGRDEEWVDPPSDVTNVAELQNWLIRRSAEHAAAFAAQPRWLAAIDQNYANPDSKIAGAMEIAFFPPVTGG
jgi:molybdopterin synthase sulfur carrier subunit